MARILDLDRFTQLLRANGAGALAEQVLGMNTVLDLACQSITTTSNGQLMLTPASGGQQIVLTNATANPPSTGQPGGPSGQPLPPGWYPGPNGPVWYPGGGDCVGGACPTFPNFPPGCGPILNRPGCPVNCDECAFPMINQDCSLWSWVEIESQLWDTDTKINQLVAGTMPLVAGASATFAQEARRTLTWIPDCVQISTVWTGSPQPGLLTYQWSSGPKFGPAAPVNFSNPQNGQQYECGPTPGTTASCIKVPFPTYKGCDGMSIGALSSLRLTVTLDATATSTLESILIVVYHKKNPKKVKKNCGSCGSGSCGGGCGGSCG